MTAVTHPQMAAPIPSAIKSPPGTKTMLIGSPGSGKTTALQTLLECHPDLKVFLIFLEPSGLSLLGGTDPKRFHWAYVPAIAADTGWDALLDSANKVNTMPQKDLQGMSNVQSNKYRQFIETLKLLSNLKCDRTGEVFGNSSKLGTDWVLGVDSLSPLNTMCMDLVAGGKPFKAIGDYGAAIEQEQKFINMLTLGHRCHFVLTAHTTKEVDQVSGGIKVMPSAIGQKFCYEIGRFFDDIVFCHNDGANFKWSTVAANVDAKARRLPLGKDFAPTFKPIFETWMKQGGVIAP